ncbi:CAF17-like 4Fe-4S cluster assembly/insertion protein YgfZ [Halalkalicoccus salilacus]|uniref:CAF17-like 4Fe-4S cluster assembly/insertion protein YgfZ n=1 Tax=Halalkalicoccus salilacus TaxID=3117459 RepID=UPI00300F1728
MTVLEPYHAEHGAVFDERTGRRLPRHYGRPERTHLAVRNAVGITEMAYGVLVVTGEDRLEYVDNAVSNRVPDADGEGCYALLCDPQGRIEHDLYVYNAGERLLVFAPPGHAEGLAAEWREKTFIQDVAIDVATDEMAVLGVHGPNATEKIASVLNNAGAPEGELVFDRGSIHDVGVTVIAGDDPTGEDSYEVVCAADEAETVLDTLIVHGQNAIPFGTRTWETLTLEAGTPLFDAELEGRLPNVLGLRNAVDFEKGCFVGQETISRVENRGQPSGRLVGLRCEALPEPGAAVFADDRSVGEVTRAVESPSLEAPIALAVVEFDLEVADLAVRVDGEEVGADGTDLPFVEGSGRSARLPAYAE